MDSHDSTASQQSLLKIYRARLKILLDQVAIFGPGDVPPHKLLEIEDARLNIRVLKTSLRNQNVKVDDIFGDEAVASAPAAIPSLEAAPTSAIVQTPQPAAGATPTKAFNAAPAAEFDFDVFISYSHADERWVEETLLKQLEAAGLRVCIDFRDFIVGKPAIINMQDAVLKSRHIVLVLTNAWIKSEWTLFESLLVRTKDPAGLHQRTIPLRLEPV